MVSNIVSTITQLVTFATEYFVPLSLFSICVIGAVGVIFDNIRNADSLEEFMDFIATDEELGNYLDTSIQIFYPEAKDFDTVENFWNYIKPKIEKQLLEYIKDKVDIPEEFEKFVTLDNIGKVLEYVVNYYDLDEKMEQFFNELSENDLEVEGLLEEIEEPDTDIDDDMK